MLSEGKAYSRLYIHTVSEAVLKRRLVIAAPVYPRHLSEVHRS